MLVLFQIIALIFSAIIHEYMHGFVAYRLGDHTAKDAGRLTINPLAHLDWMGSFILPLLMIVSGLGFVIGWAKPVPYNPYNLRDKKYGEAKVALAGPLSNLVIALIFGLILHLSPFLAFLGPNFTTLVSVVIYINLLLMIFNLLPIPPLDGSKVLALFLSPEAKQKYFALGGYGMFIILFVVMLFSPVIVWPVTFLFRLITGM